MRTALLLSALCLSVATASAATIQLDGCEDTNYTVVVKPDTVAENDLTLASSTNASEGTNSLSVTVDYGVMGQWVLGSNFTKDFATPIDLSDMEFFRYDIEIPVAADLFFMQIHFIDSEGNISRFVDSNTFESATTGFETREFHISTLQKSKWYNGGRAPNLKSITQMRFIVGNEYGATTAVGSFEFKLDDVRFETDANTLDEIVVEDFESYASDSTLQATWAHTFTPASSIALNTTDPFNGSQSATLSADIQAQYTNHARRIDFSEPLNMSAANYMRMAVKGDTTLAGYNPTAHIYLVDGDGNRAIGYVWDWAAHDEWSYLWMPFQVDGIPGFVDDQWTRPAYAASWILEDRWDGGAWNENTDLSNIVAMIISIEIQGAANPAPGPVEIGFDDIIVGFSEKIPSKASYVVNKAISTAEVPTIDGVANPGEWDAAVSPGCTNFVAHDNPLLAAVEDPEVKALYDDTNLYILVQVTTADLQQDFSPNSPGDDVNSAGDKFPFFFVTDGNMGDRFYRISLVPDPGTNTLYTWDEAANSIGYPGVGTWDAANDSGAFSYDTGTDLLTIEYMIPWTDFNFTGNVITSAPASGTDWGIQIGYSNPGATAGLEYTNWEPDGTPGYVMGKPFGTWSFVAQPELASESWELYR